MRQLDELTQLAQLALGNAFYDEYSALVNRYVQLAEGLGDADAVENRLQDMSNLYVREVEVLGPSVANLSRIHTISGSSKPKAQPTLLAALQQSGANAITINGTQVFYRRIGDPWEYTGA